MPPMAAPARTPLLFDVVLNVAPYGRYSGGASAAGCAPCGRLPAERMPPMPAPARAQLMSKACNVAPLRALACGYGWSCATAHCRYAASGECLLPKTVLKQPTIKEKRAIPKTVPFVAFVPFVPLTTLLGNRAIKKTKYF